MEAWFLLCTFRGVCDMGRGHNQAFLVGLRSQGKRTQTHREQLQRVARVCVVR